MEKIVTKEEVNQRLDNYLSSSLNETRSLISKQIKNGNILVNGNSVKPGYLIKENDTINIIKLEEDNTIKGENIPLNILYEDEYIIVIDKPSGMVVHPAPGNYHGTLVNALTNHTKLSDINGEFRPGIVHRIDKDTSGILVVAKDNKVHNILACCFKDKTIKRKYIALCNGIINVTHGKIDAPIGRSTLDRKKMMVTDINSKKAITNFTVLERYSKATLIECVLETGRTHQIRVHLAYIGHPIINDNVYGKTIVNDYGQMLHASYLGFNHPITGEFLEFNSPLPKEFNDILETFKN